MTVHLLISGFVQKVGYRQFVKKTATSLGLTGWVKNLPDNRVEILATGSKESLEKLIVRCEKGSFLAKVRDIKRDQLEEELFDEFNIIL